MRLPDVDDFSDRLRGPQVASRVGVWLGVAMTIAFVTGLWSHFQYDTPAWLTLPTGPAWLYRVTQGLHVIAGTAECLFVVFKGEATLGAYFGGFLVPSLVGNSIGGVALVASLAHGQHAPER